MSYDITRLTPGGVTVTHTAADEAIQTDGPFLIVLRPDGQPSLIIAAGALVAMEPCGDVCRARS